MKKNKFGNIFWRFIFLLLALVVYRIGVHLPVPGINAENLAVLFKAQNNGFLNLFNMFSGGALSRVAILALGIMPYISASIIMQLMTYVVPVFEQLKKEGESGRRKITFYTRCFALFLAVFQSIGLVFALEAQTGLVTNPGFYFRFTAVVTLVAGTMFLMWLGEQITERGLGNGMSMLVFAGIVAGLPGAVGSFLEMIRTGAVSAVSSLFLVVLVLAVTSFVVYVERGQRRITINYARRQVGGKILGGYSSHLPLKLNMAGVIPPIFASSIVLLPPTLIGWLGSDAFGIGFLRNVATTFSHGQAGYFIFYSSAIVFFCFFYTALVFNSRETSDNLKKSGAFVPGIRPGYNTALYIDSVLLKLTLIASLYVVFVCLIPEFLTLNYNLPFYFGGTSLLIVVVVSMDFMSQLQNYAMTEQYDSLLKKSRLSVL